MLISPLHIHRVWSHQLHAWSDQLLSGRPGGTQWFTQRQTARTHGVKPASPAGVQGPADRLHAPGGDWSCRRGQHRRGPGWGRWGRKMSDKSRWLRGIEFSRNARIQILPEKWTQLLNLCLLDQWHLIFITHVWFFCVLLDLHLLCKMCAIIYFASPLMFTEQIGAVKGALVFKKLCCSV